MLKIKTWFAMQVIMTISKSVYAMKKAQLEAAYERQQKEIADLQDFVNRNKARVATRNMAMSRQKKWIRWKLSNCRLRSQNLNFISRKSYAWTLYFPNQRPRYWLRPPFDQGSFESYLRT